LTREITVMCAVTDEANEPLILTADVIDSLMSSNCCVVQFDDGLAKQEDRTNDCDDNQILPCLVHG
jgi:hypothetical protein